MNTSGRATLPRSPFSNRNQGSAGASPYRRLARIIAGWLFAWFLVNSTTIGADSAIRFEAIQVYLDTKSEPLAAYQVSVRAIKGDVKIVGIEGGEPAAFKQPPYYDPKAIQQERVILAAFSTKSKSELPQGRIRVATIHLRITGDVEPEFEAKLQAAATDNGAKISPALLIEPMKP